MRKIREKKSTKKKKISPAERKLKSEERAFKTAINTIFRNSSFTQIATRNIGFEILEYKGEIDNIFIYENIIVISEDTCAASNNIDDHLRKKVVHFDLWSKNKAEFINVLCSSFTPFNEYIDNHKMYTIDDYILIFLYCSKEPIKEALKKLYSHIKYFEYSYIKYFERLSKTIKKTTRFELFKFLGLSKADVRTLSSAEFREIEGFVLPEARSGFDENHKIVTFYIEPEILLPLSYVLRKDASWADNEALYQRLLIRSKIMNMREYISKNKRVFINNIIGTLPEETKFYDPIKGNAIDLESLDKRKAQPIKIHIPDKFNTIGIIDGQHRIFAYHEGFNDPFEKAIAYERKKQNLLVTCIIYPRGYSEARKLIFESKLFLEINEKQSKVKADLRQSIQTIVEPYDSTSIAKRVITSLSLDGPLSNYLEVHFYDTRKIKTTSIVSYGLKYLVKIDSTSTDTFYFLWPNHKKVELLTFNEKETDLLNEYVKFCKTQLNLFFSAYKDNLNSKGLFTQDQNISRALTSTAINGLIFCFRKLIATKKTGDFPHYQKAFKKLKIDYSPKKFRYKSSHWKSLGDQLFSECFE